MKRRYLKYSLNIPLISLLVILIGTAFCLINCTRKTEVPHINVLLISIDTLRPDHLSCYGYGRDTSPTIDKLAKEGVLFENAVSSTTWTLPAHAAMFTSLPDAVHSVITTSSRLDSNRVTIQEIMKDHGYTTAAFYSCAFFDPIFGLDQGFDQYESCMTTPSVYQNEDLLELGSKWEKLIDTPGFSNNPSLRAQASDLWHQMQEMKTKRIFQARMDVTGERVTNKANNWLEDHSKEKFFLFLHYFDVHYDFVPPEPWDNYFDPDYTGSFDGRNFITNEDISTDMDEKDLNHIVALYDGEIAYTDYQLNRVMQTLEDLGIMDCTLIVITSDHGEEFFEHGMKGHRQNLYDTTLKIPLIFYLPRIIPSDKRIKSQVRIIDIFPTILNYVGIEERGEAIGKNLRGIIEGTDQEKSPPALLEILAVPGNLFQEGLRTDNWKLIIEEDLKEQNKRLLYFDLKKDAEEQSPIQMNIDPEILKDTKIFTAFYMMKQISTNAMKMEKDLPKSKESDPLEIPEEVRDRLLSLGYIH